MAVLKLKIQLRRDTSANWLHYDPVLLNGEAAVSSDLGKIKIGDGTSKWSELDYISDSTLPGFSSAETGAYPTKQADGSIKWVAPSKNTTEGIQNTLAQHEKQIQALLSKQTSIAVGDTKLTSEDDGTVRIPLATATRCGVVKGSDEINISADGELNITTVDVNKLSQKEGDSLILFGGQA